MQHEVNLLVVIDEIAVWEMNKLFRVYMCIASWRNELQTLLDNKKVNLVHVKLRNYWASKVGLFLEKYQPRP